MNYEFGFYVFMLAAFLGFELIRKVSPLLHTPLMSLTPLRLFRWGGRF